MVSIIITATRTIVVIIMTFIIIIITTLLLHIIITIITITITIMTTTTLLPGRMHPLRALHCRRDVPGLGPGGGTHSIRIQVNRVRFSTTLHFTTLGQIFILNLFKCVFFPYHAIFVIK